MAPLRIGILGAARIARGFAHSLRDHAEVRVAAVASRDGERAAAFAREFGIPRAHGSYDALLADAELDAVYIPLPNSLHAEWTMRAARAGKHVLCEKPLATSAAEARAMFACAAECGVRLVEGFPYRMQPQTLALRDLVRSGALGELRLVRASFAFPITDPADIRFDPQLGGGVLYDGGSYPVSLVRMIAGRAARRAFAVARWSPGGVDTTLAGTLEFDGELIAQIACSFGTALHRHALIAGSDAVVETGYYNHPTAGQATLTVRRGDRRTYEYETIETEARDGFVVETEGFARLIRDGDDGWPGMTPSESIDTAAMIDALLASARTGTPVDVAS